MDGWVKLHRVWSEWQHIDKPNVCHVMAYFLSIAQHDNFTYNGIKLRPGQLVISQRPLAEKLGLSRQQLRTVLGILEATHELTHVATQHGTVITLLKWGKFQGSYNDVNPPINPPINPYKQEYNNKNKKTPTVLKKNDDDKKLFIQLKSELETGTTWMERFAMDAKLKPDVWPQIFKEFAIHYAAREKSARNYSDLKDHLRNWVTHPSTKSKHPKFYR